MRSKIIVIVMSMLLVMPMTAFADEQMADAGVTPDSWLYSFDQLGEEVALFLESDLVEEAKLLDEFAEERLAESNEMATIGETVLAEETLIEYQETVDEVANKVDQAIEEGQDVTDVINTISDRSVIREDVLNKVLENLPEQASEIVREKLGASNLRLATVKNVLIDKVGGEFAETANANELSLRETLAVKSLADQTGKTVDEVLALFVENGKDIGLTITTLGLTEEAMKIINEDFKVAKDQIKETFKTGKEAIKDEIKAKVEVSKEKAKELREQANQAKEQAKETASQAREQADQPKEQEKASEVKQEEASQVEEQAKEDANLAEEQAEEASQIVEQAKEEAKEEASQAQDQAKTRTEQRP